MFCKTDIWKHDEIIQVLVDRDGPDLYLHVKALESHPEVFHIQ